MRYYAVSRAPYVARKPSKAYLRPQAHPDVESVTVQAIESTNSLVQRFLRSGAALERSGLQATVQASDPDAEALPHYMDTLDAVDVSRNLARRQRQAAAAKQAAAAAAAAGQASQAQADAGLPKEATPKAETAAAPAAAAGQQA